MRLQCPSRCICRPLAPPVPLHIASPPWARRSSSRPPPPPQSSIPARGRGGGGRGGAGQGVNRCGRPPCRCEGEGEGERERAQPKELSERNSADSTRQPRVHPPLPSWTDRKGCPPPALLWWDVHARGTIGRVSSERRAVAKCSRLEGLTASGHGARAAGGQPPSGLPPTAASQGKTWAKACGATTPTGPRPQSTYACAGFKLPSPLAHVRPAPTRHSTRRALRNSHQAR
jgi:hypothetical protein